MGKILLLCLVVNTIMDHGNLYAYAGNQTDIPLHKTISVTEKKINKAFERYDGEEIEIKNSVIPFKGPQKEQAKETLESILFGMVIVSQSRLGDNCTAIVAARSNDEYGDGASIDEVMLIGLNGNADRDCEFTLEIVSEGGITAGAATVTGYRAEDFEEEKASDSDADQKASPSDAEKQATPSNATRITTASSSNAGSTAEAEEDDTAVGEPFEEYYTREWKKAQLAGLVTEKEGILASIAKLVGKVQEEHQSAEPPTALSRSGDITAVNVVMEEARSEDNFAYFSITAASDQVQAGEWMEFRAIGSADPVEAAGKISGKAYFTLRFEPDEEAEGEEYVEQMKGPEKASRSDAVRAEEESEKTEEEIKKISGYLSENQEMYPLKKGETWENQEWYRLFEDDGNEEAYYYYSPENRLAVFPIESGNSVEFGIRFAYPASGTPDGATLTAYAEYLNADEWIKISPGAAGYIEEEEASIRNVASAGWGDVVVIPSHTVLERIGAHPDSWEDREWISYQMSAEGAAISGTSAEQITWTDTLSFNGFHLKLDEGSLQVEAGESSEESLITAEHKGSRYLLLKVNAPMEVLQAEPVYTGNKVTGIRICCTGGITEKTENRQIMLTLQVNYYQLRMRDILTADAAKDAGLANHAVLAAVSGQEETSRSEGEAAIPVRDAEEHDILVKISGEETESTPVRSGAVRRLSRARTAEEQPGSIADHLTNAAIMIDGNPYDGVSTLDPSQTFMISLNWNLVRKDLEGTLTYQYTFPEAITIQDTEEMVLYDKNNNRKGVYQISGGVLTVTYDQVSDEIATEFSLQASWNQEKIDQQTEIQWNGELSTKVKFDKAGITVTKQPGNTVNIPDGTLIKEYAADVKARGTVKEVTLTDTLTSEKFHFVKGYYKVGGDTYDYRYQITTNEGTSEYRYGNFTVEAGPEKNQETVVFSNEAFRELSKDKSCRIEYAVQLDADKRFELDQYQATAGLENSVTAAGRYGSEDVSSTSTITDSYHADNKWVVKERGKLSEDDVTQEKDVPWTVQVNPDRNYIMSGAVIGDSIRTDGVVYKTDAPFEVTSVSDDAESGPEPVEWIELDDDTINKIWEARQYNVVDLFFTTSEGKTVLSKINEKVDPDITESNKEALSDYVFVNTSKTQFIWFTPPADKPTGYKLSYITDVTNAKESTLVNSAEAGWKRYVTGVVNGSFLQEVGIKKENNGVYQDDGKWKVDWVITLEVPGDRNAIENAFIYDALPFHENTGGCDWLDGLTSDQYDRKKDLNKDERSDYFKELTKNVFEIETTSSDPAVTALVQQARTSLGHPVTGLTDGADFLVYGQSETNLGQLEITNAVGGEASFNGMRLSPSSFSIWLGDLPDTVGKEGYVITIKYTTQVDPKLVETLEDQETGYNYAGLFQRKNDQDVYLAGNGAWYWIINTQNKKVLEKSVVNFDSEHNIITYQVEINPEAALTAEWDTVYSLKDQLNLPGAQYLPDSFRLDFKGELTDEPKFLWDDSRRTIIWTADSDYSKYPLTNKTDLVDWLAAAVNERVKCVIDNKSADDSSSFTFSISNRDYAFVLASGSPQEGKLAPMILTYQVKLPNREVQKESIVNTADLWKQTGNNDPVHVEGVTSEFEYTSALHKSLAGLPDIDNGYCASFIIDVDKKAKDWGSTTANGSFTVSDEMSKSLALDIDSIKVYGISAGSDGKENRELLSKDQWTAAYDILSSDSKNFLSVIIQNEEKYGKYSIEYDAKLLGQVNQSVDFDNVAAIEGTDIKSETVSRNVFIQKQTGSVVTTDYKVKLLKYDGSNTSIRLSAGFKLYSYKDGDWEPRTYEKDGKTFEKFQTGEDGTLELNNRDFPGLGLAKETWYKLEEVDPPDGYKGSTTYFYIGPMGVPEEKPKEITDYTIVSTEYADEITVHQISNYKLASLKLHKIDSKTKDSLSGAEFALYSEISCRPESQLQNSKTENGICTFENLIAGKTYYLKETKAPDGYHLEDSVYTVMVDKSGKTITVRWSEDGKLMESVQQDESEFVIENTANVILPQTGGPGTDWHHRAGLTMMLSALIMLAGYTLEKQKRKRRG